MAGLQSAHPVDTVTVADQDITAEDLEAAAADFLQRTGWAALDAQLAAELAADMAADVADIAADYPVGTRLRASFNHHTDEWTFTVE